MILSPYKPETSGWYRFLPYENLYSRWWMLDIFQNVEGLMRQHCRQQHFWQDKSSDVVEWFLMALKILRLTLLASECTKCGHMWRVC